MKQLLTLTCTVVAECLRCLPFNPGVMGSSSTSGHDHDSSHDTSTGWFQETYSRVINIIKNQAKINNIYV